MRPAPTLIMTTKNINVTYDFPPLDTLNPVKDWKRFTRDHVTHVVFTQRVAM